MKTVSLASDISFAATLALARSHTGAYVRRRLGNAAALALAEVAALSVALLAGGWMRQMLLGEVTSGIGAGWMVVPMYLAAAFATRLLPGWGLGVVEELRRMALVLLGVGALTMTGLWLAHINAEGVSLTASRLALALGGLFAMVLVPLARTKTKALLITMDRWGVDAVVYGAGRAGSLVVRQLQEQRGLGYTPVAVFASDPDAWGGYLDAVPIAGDLARVVPTAAVAFLALPEESRDAQIALLEGPLACYRTVVIVPDLLEAPSLWVTPRDFGGLLGLEVTSTLSRRMPRIVKRAVDLAAVLACAPLWMPLVGLSALAVWLGDRVSPFYGQRRVGYHGAEFTTSKLRTMVPDAEAVLARALDADPALREEWEACFKLEHDPRITRVGAFLRRTSLDELPQLFDVLRGTMSLVGPRPLPRYHHDELPRQVRELRERVRPGITGLWQVSGRSDSGNAGMERWDPYYVRNWSFWLDVVILVRTLQVVAKGSGAY